MKPFRSNDPDEQRRRRSRIIVTLAAATGFLLATDLAFASNWTVGLAPGSSGQAQAATVSNLTISAVSTPSPANLLYPGSYGDVVLTISNPNPYPVTLTAIQLPANTVGAAGYTNSNLSGAITLCAATLSGVTWRYSTGTAGTSQTLSTALVIGPSGNANNPLTVTLTNWAAMASSSPAACEGAYFSMPSLFGVTASAGGSPITTSPATDS